MIKINRSFIISLILAAVICGLGVLDLPAYVSCKHIGVCEFLDLPGIKTDSAESQMTTTDWQSGGIHVWCLPEGWPGYLPAGHLSATNTQHHPDLGEHFFPRYIHQRQGVYLSIKWVKIIILNYCNNDDDDDEFYSRYSKDIKLTSQVLRILASSVIQS